MKTRNIGIILCLVSVFSVMAFADFNVDVDPQSVSVYKGNQTQVDIDITTSDDSGRYSISVKGWKSWFTLDSYAPRVDESHTSRLYLSPDSTVEPKTYQIKIIVESPSGEKQSKEVVIKVRNKYDVILNQLNYTKELKPTETMDIYMKITNEGIEDLKDVKLTANAKQVEEVTYTIDELEVGEAKEFEKQIQLPKNFQAGEHELEITIRKGTEEVSRITKTYIVEKVPLVDFEKTTEDLVFGTKNVMTIENVGNDDLTDFVIEQEVSSAQKMFYYGTGEIQENKIVWNIEKLSPGEDLTIEYQINYLSLVALIILLVILGWYYMTKVRVLRIRKFIMNRSSIEKGHEVKVGIELKNRSGNEVKSVTVEDFVPSIFSVKIDSSIKPTMKKTNDGTRLIWKLRTFSEDEERVLSYKLTPVVGIEGTITLRQAKVTYKKDDRELKSLSKRPKAGL